MGLDAAIRAGASLLLHGHDPVSTEKIEPVFGEPLPSCPFCGGGAYYSRNPATSENTMASCVRCGATAFWRKWCERAPVLDRPYVVRASREPADFTSLVALLDHTEDGRAVKFAVGDLIFPDGRHEAAVAFQVGDDDDPPVIRAALRTTTFWVFMETMKAVFEKINEMKNEQGDENVLGSHASEEILVSEKEETERIRDHWERVRQALHMPMLVHKPRFWTEEQNRAWKLAAGSDPEFAEALRERL